MELSFRNKRKDPSKISEIETLLKMGASEKIKSGDEIMYAKWVALVSFFIEDNEDDFPVGLSNRMATALEHSDSIDDSYYATIMGTLEAYSEINN